MNDVPPAASLSEDNPPAVRLELEADWETSIQSVWDKIKTTKAPTRDDWIALIAAERISRVQWLEQEAEGGRRKKKGKSLDELMGSTVAPDGELKPPKKTRARKPKAVDEEARVNAGASEPQ